MGGGGKEGRQLPGANATQHHTLLPSPSSPLPCCPQANATFIEDPEMAARLMEANPNSFRKLVSGVGRCLGLGGLDGWVDGR